MRKRRKKAKTSWVNDPAIIETRQRHSDTMMLRDGASFRDALRLAAAAAAKSRAGSVLQEVEWDLINAPLQRRLEPYRFPLAAADSALPEKDESKGEEEEPALEILPDRAVDSTTGDAIGTGAAVWTAGIGLSMFLRANPEKLAGRLVVELGAGTGLVGMVAAATCQCHHVVLTDLPSVLAHMATNVRHNVGRGVIIDADQLTCVPLPWGDEDAACQVVDALPSSSARRRSGVVVAADVVYKREHGPLLMRTLRVLLKKLTAVADGDDDADDDDDDDESSGSRQPPGPAEALLAFDKRGREGLSSFFEEIRKEGSGLTLDVLPYADMPAEVRFVHFGLARITIDPREGGAAAADDQ